MKYYAILTLAGLIWAGSASAQIPFLAAVRGNITVEQTGSNGTRIVTSRLNNARIFEEFGVSPADYSLVVVPRTSAVLQLVPTSVSAGLPVVEVVRIAPDSNSLVNSKTGLTVFEAPVGSTASSNIFATLRGTLSGRGRLNDDRNDFRNVSFDVVGSGNTNEQKRVILRFHVESQKKFQTRN